MSGEVDYGPIMVQQVFTLTLGESMFALLPKKVFHHTSEDTLSRRISLPTEKVFESPLISMTVKSSATEPILSRIDSHNAHFQSATLFALLTKLLICSFN